VLSKSVYVACVVTVAAGCSSTPTDTTYFPGPGARWESRTPEAVGMDSALLAEAVTFAIANEPDSPRDLEAWMRSRAGDDPYAQLIGDLKPRGGPAGLVVRNGYIVAEWGDTKRVDVTYSVTKSFLSTVVGLAVADGVIRDVHDPVSEYVHDGGFDSPHNAQITWHHLLRQTNEWEGELFGKPDVADRRRGRDRQLQTPGTFWEYNDVRVNRTALAALRVWQRALPDVLQERVMKPIGATDTWEWHGYHNSDVEVNGELVKSVSGGGHWGGGMWISSRDQARFGYLYLRRGRWEDEQLLPEEWVDATTTPTDIQPTYGYMWWLNTDRELWASAPGSSFAARGGGSNVIWVDPEHDLVVVIRWINGNAVDGVLQRVLAAVEARADESL
jgi:CubicO group peptidase (beta-lactamase class C family)